MYRFAVVIFVMFPFISFSRNNDLSLIGARIIEQTYNRVVKDSTDIQAQQFADNLNADGYWSDIDYSDTRRSSWSPTMHISRMTVMSNAFSNPDSRLYNSETLKNAIKEAFSYWFDKKLVCPNWWYNEIGIPKIMGPLLLSVYPYLNDSMRNSAIKYMQNAKIAMTGQNRVWLSFNVLMTAILQENASLAEEAINEIKAEITVSEKEGIQPDWSFHQHGAQPQFGNYGLAFISSISEIGILFCDTKYAFSDEQIDILRNFTMNGMSRVVRNSYFDVNSCGRQLFYATQKNKAATYGEVMLNMAKLDPLHKKSYEKQYAWNMSGKGDDLVGGYNHFYRSDMSVYRSKKWFSSLKMSSERVIAAEFVNGENLRGYNLSDGALMLYRDGDEYVDIFAVWKWRMIPGVTAVYRDNGQYESVNEVYKVIKNRNKLAGGVEYADGKYGLSAMNIDKDDIKVNKSWFFCDDYIYCIGSGLTSEADTVKTAVNQTLRKGDYKIIKENDLYSCTHNNIRYNFYGSVQPEIECSRQSGYWNDIIKTYQGKETVVKDVFGIYINHGKPSVESSFVYSIEPDACKKSHAAVGNAKVIKITKDIHAVKHPDGIYQIVMFKPAKGVVIDNKLSVSSNEPVVIIADCSTSEIKIKYETLTGDNDIDVKVVKI